MKSLPPCTPPGKLTRSDMQAAVEAMLRDTQAATAGLLQEIDDVDPREAEMLRAEAGTLNELAFVLTRCLCHQQIEQAYAIVAGAPDEAGTVLGLTA